MAGLIGAAREGNILSPFPQHEATKFIQLRLPFNNAEKVVASQVAHFTGKLGTAIGKQDLCFAIATWIKQNIAARRMTCMVFEIEISVEIAERYPNRLTAPPGVNHFVLKGQQRTKPRAGRRRQVLMPFSFEAEGPGLYL